MFKRISPPALLLTLFGAASLAAVLTGAYVCLQSGLPTALVINNIGAWAIGAVAAIILAAVFRPVFTVPALRLVPFALAATFVFRPQFGVHRWIDAGPLHINAALLLLPAATVAFAVLAPQRRWPWVIAFLIQLILIAQPDASQATAMGGVIALVALFAIERRLVKAGVIAAAAALTAIAWLRRDLLQPVPEVEEIIALAATVSPAAAIAAIVFLTVTAAAPLAVVRPIEPIPRLAVYALTLCLIFWSATPLLGAYPVPFVGIGLSPIIGAWLGVGLLSGVLKWPSPLGR